MDRKGRVIKERYENCLTPALHLYWPIAIARGDGVYVEATDGKRYLDFSSGLAVLNIGHSHPEEEEGSLLEEIVSQFLCRIRP